MSQTHTVYARDIAPGEFFRGPGGCCVYMRLKPDSVKKTLRLSASPRKVYAVTHSGTVVGFRMEAEVLKASLSEFVAAVQGCAIGNGVKEKQLPRAEDCKSALDKFIALESPADPEMEKRFRCGLAAALGEHANKVTVENAKEREKLAVELMLARNELKELLGQLANLYHREDVAWSQAVDLVKLDIIDRAKKDAKRETELNGYALLLGAICELHGSNLTLGQACSYMEQLIFDAKQKSNVERPGPGTMLKASETWIGCYFKSRDRFYVRRKAPPGCDREHSIHALDPNDDEFGVGNDVQVCVISEEEFNAQKKPVPFSILASAVRVGGCFRVVSTGKLYVRKEYPSTYLGFERASYVYAEDQQGKPAHINVEVAVELLHPGEFYAGRSIEAGRFNPSVRDVYRVPGHNGRYHVYKVNAVNLGGENQEGVVELETVDRKPNPTDKPLIVPMCILEALDPEPVN